MKNFTRQLDKTLLSWFGSVIHLNGTARSWLELTNTTWIKDQNELLEQVIYLLSQRRSKTLPIIKSLATTISTSQIKKDRRSHPDAQTHSLSFADIPSLLNFLTTHLTNTPTIKL